MVRCHVKGCHRSQAKDKNHHFFSEPANLMIREQWRKFCKIGRISKDVRICSDHFHGTCFRKKTPPRPLLMPEAVPTIPPIYQKGLKIKAIEQTKSVKYDQVTSDSNDPKKLNEDVIEFMRPALPHECLHNSKTIIVDIEKATENTPAIVHIQTNSKIRVVMSDETDCEDLPISQDQCSSDHASGNNDLTVGQIITNSNDLTVGLDLFPESKTTKKSPLKKGNSCIAMSSKHSVSNLKLSKNQQSKSTAKLSQRKQNLKTTGKRVELSPKSLRITTQKQRIANLRSRIQRFQKQRENLAQRTVDLEIDSVINTCAKYLDKDAHTFFASHLRLCGVKKNRRRYTKELKDIALSIKYHSPKAYRFICKILHLPSIRTLNEYEKQFPIYPGINQTVLNELKRSSEQLPIEARVVNILFDEINLSTEIHYDNHLDQFKGIADDGKTRTAEIAKSALVAMITWIHKPIKEIVGYWLLGEKNNTKLTHDVMIDTTEQLFAHGLIVKTMICDQGPRNLGILKQLKINSKKPYFTVPGYTDKVYLIFDPPHLLKSMRNNLSTKPLYYREGRVDWKVIEKIYELSKEVPLNMIPKVNDNHFSLNNMSKMTVSLAAQIFSDSMYTAYLVYSTMHPELFPDSDRTGQFLTDMDKLFDTLNSRLERKSLEKKLNYAISKDSEHKKFLNEMLGHLANSHFITTTGRSKPSCLTGLELVINSILQLSSDLSENYNIPILKTRRLNQDPLENLFAIIRQQHGCSTNPSPLQFETGLKQIFITHLSKLSKISNCEVDDNKIFAKLSCIETGSAQLKPQMDYKEFLQNKLSVNNIMGDFESQFKERSETAELTETNAVFYICGYLAKKFLKSHNTCNKCIEYLILPNSNSNFHDYKMFTLMKEHADNHKLKYSSEILFKSVLKWEKIYQSHIQKIFHFTKICEYLNPILCEQSPHFQLCTQAATNAFVNSFIKIRCFWEARFRRRDIQQAKKQKSKNTKMKKFGC